jgi:hypothetical protein
VGKMDAVLRHYLDQVAVAEFVARYQPTHRMITSRSKLPHCKQLLAAPQLAHYASLFSSKDPYIPTACLYFHKSRLGRP